jgi:hypothetical protein
MYLHTITFILATALTTLISTIATSTSTSRYYFPSAPIEVKTKQNA